MSQVQIKKVSWWHERLADWLIANPHKKLKHAATEFECSVPWLSIVKNSDAFKEVFQQRSAAVSDGVVNGTVASIAGVREKTETMTELALDALNERLAREVDCKDEVVPRQELLEIVDKGMARLGYGANKSLPAPISINADKVAIVNRQELSAARDKIMQASGVETNQIEAKPQELVPVDEKKDKAL